MAADLGTESVPVPAAEATAYAFSWTGPEFGLFGGGNWTDADFSAGGVSLLDGEHKGGHLGAFGGYQYQFNNRVVLGVEGDVSHTWNKKTYSAFADETGTDWSGSARARVGYGFDRLLVYATGGFAMTRGYVDVPGFSTEHENFNGYTIGAGVDYAITDNIFARAEYRFNDFQNDKILGLIDTKLDQHMVNVGVGMKF
jgi:outer membrane immunogenic protein